MEWLRAEIRGVPGGDHTEISQPGRPVQGPQGQASRPRPVARIQGHVPSKCRPPSGARVELQAGRREPGARGPVFHPVSHTLYRDQTG